MHIYSRVFVWVYVYMYIYINTIIASISPAHDLSPLHKTTSLMKIPFMEMNMFTIQGQHPASTFLHSQLPLQPSPHLFDC